MTASVLRQTLTYAMNLTFKCKLCYFAIIFKTTLTDNSLSQVEIEYKLLKRGLLTKWLMHLWDKLTDCSLSPIVDFFGGVTRLHIACRAKVFFLKIAKSVSELSGSDLMKTEKCYLFWKKLISVLSSVHLTSVVKLSLQGPSV